MVEPIKRKPAKPPEVPTTFIEEGWEYSDIVWSGEGEAIDYTALSPEGERYTKVELDLAVAQQQDVGQVITDVFPDITPEDFFDYVETDFDSFVVDMRGYTEEKALLLKQLGYPKSEIDAFYRLEPVIGAIPVFDDWVIGKGFTPESLAEDMRAIGATEDLIPEMIEQAMAELRAIYEYEHDLGRWGTAIGELDKIIFSEPERLPEVAKVFGQSLLKLPRQIGAAILQTVQGQGGASVVDKDWGDRIIEEAQEDLDKFREDIAKQYPNSQLMVELASLSQNLAFSITSMLSGLAVGVPLALTPIPGARILAYTSGTAASGYVAYQMTTYQIMQQYLELKDAEKRAEFGIGLTQFEEDALKVEFHNLAVKYGLWEAIPEAISNLAFFSILTDPLGKMVGRSIATRIIAKVAGMYGQELLTETITQKGQAAIEVYAGLREKDIGWVESFKEIAPQTFLLTTVMAGSGQVIISSKQGIAKIKNSLTKEIGVNHSQHEELTNNIEENIEEAVKFEPKVEEVAVEVPAVPEVGILEFGQEATTPAGIVAKKEGADLVVLYREGEPIGNLQFERVGRDRSGVNLRWSDPITGEGQLVHFVGATEESIMLKIDALVSEHITKEPIEVKPPAVEVAKYKDYQEIHDAIKRGELKIGDKTTVSAYGGLTVEIVKPEYEGEIDTFGLPIKYRIKEVTPEEIIRPTPGVAKPPVKTIEETVESEVPPSDEEVIPKGIVENIPQLAEVGAKEQVRPTRKVLIKLNQWRNLFKPIQEAEVLMQEERARFETKLKEVAGWVGKSKERRAIVFQELESPGTTPSNQLSMPEKRAITWFNEFFNKWADRLELPVNRRIENYITHIFEEQVKQEENITPEMATAMEYGIPRKIFNPFTQERLGAKAGLITDPFLAIQAYESKELKVVYYDPLLQKIAAIIESPSTPESTKNYLKNYTKRMTGDISNIDKAFNITIKEFAEKIRGTPVIGERLYEKLTQGNPAGMAAYNMTGGLYTLFLGFKATSAIRNLSQHTLIIGEVGPVQFLKGMGLRFTTEGKAMMKKSLVLRSRKFAYTAGLDASFVGVLESKFGRVAMKMFRTADWQNVADAFLAGYSEAKSLLPEANEQVWIDRGDEVAAKTQYLYTKMNSMALSQNAPGRMLSMLTTWTENWIELTSDWIKRTPSQVYLEQERLTGKKISGANWSSNYKAILTYALIVGLAMYYDDETRIKLKEYTGVGSLKYLAGTVGGEFPALQTYGSILKVATGFALDDDRMLAEGMYEMKAFWPGILKQLDAVSSGEKDWMTLLFYTESKNFEIKRLKDKWKKGFKPYDDLSDPIIRANVYPTLSKSQAQNKYREENPLFEAQKFIVGDFTILKSDEARAEVLRLIEENKINPDLVDGYAKIFSADIKSELQEFEDRIGGLEKFEIGKEAVYFKTSNYVSEINRLVKKHGRVAVMSNASPLTKFIIGEQDTWLLFDDYSEEGRILYRQQHPEDEASMYLFGHSNIQAFQNPKSAEIMLGLMKKYNIKPEAVPAFIEKPERYDELFTPIFNLKIETFDLDTVYENFSNTESPTYLESIPDSDHPDYEKGREYAREQLKESNPLWVANLRRIEAHENEASDVIVEKWVEKGVLVDKFGVSSPEVKVWFLDNSDTHDWARKVWAKEDKFNSDNWNEPVLRLDVQWAKEDDEYDAIQNDDDIEQARLRDIYLSKHPEYYRVRYIRDTYTLRDGDYNPFPDELRESYADYYTNLDLKKPDNWKEIEKTDKWYEDDWFLLANPELHQAFVDFGDWEKLRDLENIPTREIFKKYLEYVKLPKGKRRDDFRWENQDLDAWLFSSGEVTVKVTEKRRRKELTPTEEFLEDVLEHETEFDEAMQELEQMIGALK